MNRRRYQCLWSFTVRKCNVVHCFQTLFHNFCKWLLGLPYCIPLVMFFTSQVVEKVDNWKQIEVNTSGNAEFELDMKLKDPNSKVYVFKVTCSLVSPLPKISVKTDQCQYF